MWDIIVSILIVSFMDIFFPQRTQKSRNNQELSDYALLGGMENQREDLERQPTNTNDPFLNDSSYDFDSDYSDYGDYDF